MLSYRRRLRQSLPALDVKSSRRFVIYGVGQPNACTLFGREIQIDSMADVLFESPAKRRAGAELANPAWVWFQKRARSSSASQSIAGLTVALFQSLRHVNLALSSVDKPVCIEVYLQGMLRYWRRVHMRLYPQTRNCSRRQTQSYNYRLDNSYDHPKLLQNLAVCTDNNSSAQSDVESPHHPPPPPCITTPSCHAFMFTYSAHSLPQR